jgi:phytoene synthase
VSPDDYCTAKAAPPGSVLHYALRTVPLERRRAATAVYAFAAEIRAATADVQEPDVARARVAWWRAEIQRAFAGAPQHPVARALMPAARDFALPQESFQRVLDGAALDLDPHRLRDGEALRLYLHHTGSVPAQLAAGIYGYRDPRTLRHAAELGLSLGFARVIGELGADLRRDRSYLPRDLLARHGLSDRDLRAGVPAAAALIGEQTAEAITLVEAAARSLPPADRRAQRAGLALLAMERALLDEIKQAPLQVLRSRVALTPIRKFWITWKTTAFTH